MPRLDVQITSRVYPPELVRPLLRVATEGVAALYGDPGHVALNFCDSPHSFSGRAWSRIVARRSNRFGLKDRAASGSRARRMVLVRIGQPTWFPCDTRYPGLVTAPLIHLASWREAVVVVTAHELAHCVQFAEKLRRSEVQADRIAKCVLDRYRVALAAGHYRDPPPPHATLDDPVTGSWGVFGEPGAVAVCHYREGAWAVLDAVAPAALPAALARHGAPAALATALPAQFHPSAAPRPATARVPWYRTLAAKFAEVVESAEGAEGGTAWFYLRRGWSCDGLHAVREDRATAHALLQDAAPCTCEGCVEIGPEEEPS